MFKLMIADDNPYIRQELSKFIDWEDFNFELIGTYPNGRELLSAAQNCVPDVVITDISMPQMNGMELSANLYQLYPDMKIIFISEHSEFEYAKKAMNLHILDYIVKPVIKEQLTDVMKRVLDQLQKEQQRHFERQISLEQREHFRKIALSHYVSKLLFHPDNEVQVKKELEKLGIFLSDNFHLYIVCYLLEKKEGTNPLINSEDYFQILLNNNLINSHIIPIPSEENNNRFLLITDDFTVPESEQLAKFCIDAESQMSIKLMMGYSDLSTTFSNLPVLHEQSQVIFDFLKNATVKTPIISYQDIQAESKVMQTETADATDNSYNEKMNVMRKYIEENYMEPITTDDVANSVYFSPGYANLLFNEEYGVTIFGYITQYRMKKAKEYLKDTNEQITRIAELVGYSGKTSFYLAFKRHTGISPTEYRLSCNQ